jgi:hypothetical protein
VPLLLVIHGGPVGVFVNSFIGVASPYPIAAAKANMAWFDRFVRGKAPSTSASR